MGSARRNPPGLSVHRSFVVEIAAGADVRAGRIAGRVEHVVTGRSADFSAAGELFDFVARVLDGGGPGRGSPADEGRKR